MRNTQFKKNLRNSSESMDMFTYYGEIKKPK